MSVRIRLVLFGPAAAGLAGLMLWAFSGLPDFGDYRGPYGHVLNDVAPAERHSANVVTAVVFDYRGLDTMGEELILFAAALAVALLLREVRARDVGEPRERVRSESLRGASLVAVPVVAVAGLAVVAHGPITPGGGFQGGVVVASAFLLVFLAAEYRAFRRLAPKVVLDAAEGTGAGAFVGLGALSLALGLAFLENFLPNGRLGTLTSAGGIPVLNWAVALEVAAAFTLIFSEFLEEIVARNGDRE